MKTKTIFTCQKCGYQSAKWLGKCPDCQGWNSFVEENYQDQLSVQEQIRPVLNVEPILLKDVASRETERYKTKIKELDRVLGGGIVLGSVTLIGGDPGIGKSTISLQISNNLSLDNYKVLYVSAEESTSQTKLRADRLGAHGKDKLYIVNQVDLGFILEYIKKIKPDFVIIDSIQVIFDSRISSSPGSVSQVRECAGILTQTAKLSGIPIFIIGHVTKEGAIAGPRVLEHIVDTVLYFEGERYSTYRMLRVVKNRFGSTNEIGVFEMGLNGLKEVENPSQIFLQERPKNVSGSSVTCILEGTRPLLVEIQALVSKAGFGYATRKAQGIDYNRLSLLVAVLEKRLQLHLETQDIFVNIAGGIKVTDPAVDLALVFAVASGFLEKPIPEDLVMLGEVGLASEVRSISNMQLRINEIERMGFKRIIMPKNNLKGLDKKNKIELIGINSIKEAMEAIW
ncbi:MAG: DNA repair protein RadA [Candidatus Omnitrophota bacterium]